MDPLTHALASYTLKRASFPRAPLSTTIAMLVAGTIADVDVLSKFAGSSAFLTFHRAYCHSLLAALFFSLLVTLSFFLRKRGRRRKQKQIRISYGYRRTRLRRRGQLKHAPGGRRLTSMMSCGNQEALTESVRHHQ